MPRESGARIFFMYEVGNKVWYVAYYDKNYIAIESTITEIDDHARKQHPNATIFYDLDIIIGHNVAGYELLDSEKEVEEYFDDILQDKEDLENLNEFSFEEYQEYKKKFIKSTWESNGYKHPGFDEVDMGRKVLTLKQYVSRE